MAFFSAFSSSIGKRLLLFGLRQIDILDKDPSDFVSVDVGKKTTLEVRDVGLHVKKLIALLHVKLPPEIHISKARASLLRVTFVLDFGVPQIIIDIDGVQLHARTVEDKDLVDAKPRGKEPQPPRSPVRPRSPRRRGSGDYSSDEDSDDEHIPTVDDLAQSFIREEPDEEIRELEEALNTQSEYMQESESEYGDDESVAGVGAPLGLPTVLKNVLNTALDRLRITANHIDVQVEDQIPSSETLVEDDEDGSDVSLNFHVERVVIDSVTAPDARVEITSSTAAELPQASRVGKRRMRIENMYARLVSDAENFATYSRISRPLSPADTRSEASSLRKSQSEIAASRASTGGVSSKSEPLSQSVESRGALETGSRVLEMEPEPAPEPTQHVEDVAAPLQSLERSHTDESTPTLAKSQPRLEPEPMEASTHTVDEDRFADAASDDGMDEALNDSLSQSRQSTQSSIPRDMSASSILYDDEGILEYAMDNSMLGSHGGASIGDLTSSRYQDERRFQDLQSSHQSSDRGSSIPPTSSELLAQASRSFRSDRSSPRIQEFDPAAASTDNLAVAVQHEAETHQPQHDIPSPEIPQHELPQDQTPEPEIPLNKTPQNEMERSTASLSSDVEQDLTESRLFTHDDAESMYMSAMSEAPPHASRGPAIPGAWDSASNSSQGTASDTSAPIPASMIAGSILVPGPEATDDGCETPRPGSRQSSGTSTQEQFRRSSGSIGHAGSNSKIAKLFFTVDEVTVWFPLGLSEEQQPLEPDQEQPLEESGFSFSRPDLGADSIFQDMPGSFSNYAHSTSRRKGSVDMAASVRKRPDVKRAPAPVQPRSEKKKSEPTVSVEVGSVIGHIDFSTGRIIFQMMQRFLAAVGGETPTIEEKAKTKAEPSKPDNAPDNSKSAVDISVKHFGIAWLEQLMTESLLGNDAPRSRLDLNPPNAILKLGLSSIQATSQTQIEQLRLRLLIGNFTLSSLDQDILSFRKPRPRSRRLAPSTGEELKSDIEIVYEQAKERRITIATRPVRVKFDMQKADEALSSFGGFSGVLEMGSSISSGANIHSPVSPTPNKPRGVHFGDAAPPPPPVSSATPTEAPKIDIRLEEVSFALQGQSCALQIQTTAVKAAIRASNVRLKVTEVQISGPHVTGSDAGAPLLLDIKDTTVNFRFTPDEADLTRLISMINPSKDPYENDGDILIDTLLRQRRKGSVVRAEVARVGLRVSDVGALKTFDALGAEVAKLSRVTKYLPDDDRPGILTLATVREFEASALINEQLGDVLLSLQNASVAHVGVPFLLAAEIGTASLQRTDEILIHEVATLPAQDQLPMIMARIIGDEIEPVIKAKLFNVCAEYHVTTVMAALGISENGTADDIALGLASSVATITGASSPKALSRQSSQSSSPTTANAKPFHIDLLLRSCALGLNPRNIPSKALFVLTNAHFLGKQSKKTDYSITLELREASIHAIDDVARFEEQEPAPAKPNPPLRGNSQLHELQCQGFVSLSAISAAKILVDITGDDQDQPRVVDVEFKNKLFVLEACADSTQTLIGILNGLQPPTPPSTALQYRTVVPLQQMMESFTGDAFDAPDIPEEENFMDNADLVADEVPTNLEFVGSFYNQESLPSEEDLGDSLLDEDDLGVLATPPPIRQRGDKRLLESFQEQYEVAEGEKEFEFEENYFQDSDSEHKGNARKWDSAKNQYHLTNEFKTPDAPLKVRVRDLNIILNLFDGYDWPKTRAILTEAVENLETRAEERRHRPRDDDEDEFEVEQDFLFNSVWIGVPLQDERGALARRINHDIDDLASETGSYATSTATRSTGATARPRSSHKSSHRRRLKLERSKHKKIAFELTGVAVDMIVFPPDSGETQNSLDVRIQDFEIFDHVPTSTWKKFVTGLIDPAQREMNKPLIRLELQTVRPVTDLAASELVIKVTVSPLRLHVDQDALDFITRFFEFKPSPDPLSPASPSSSSDQPFIQRLEVMSVTLKLDYKPKRVDYRGLRSGHTTEFMNFLILDGSDIVLRHAILYGITSFDKLHKTLNDVWMPDVKRNQLPGVLSGLAAVRPLVNVGSGVRDLVVVPMREYRKDGRIVRSLQKGVYAFAKNTTSEAARLGARVAIGAQTLLEGAETFLNPTSPSNTPSSGGLHDWDDLDPTTTASSSSPGAAGDTEVRAVSNYANQPLTVRAGLRSAARHLERDLLTARDAVIAIPAEVMEEGSGVGIARAIARRAPTVVLRPAVGGFKAIGNAMMGVGNALDGDSGRKVGDKYKSY